MTNKHVLPQVHHVRIVHWPRSEDDPRQRSPDISYAGEVFGWISQTQLADGLMPKIEYFDTLRSDERIRPHINEQPGVKT